MAAFAKIREFRKKLLPYLIEEKVLATLNVSNGEDGTIFVQGGGSYKKEEPIGPPNLVVMTETYNRLYRLIEKKKDVQLEVDVKVAFTDEDPDAAINVIAEIPGSDKKDEFVMLGAHLDSWHGATGATDNAAGVAVVMEAVRMLTAIGFKPRRTIRIALWGGEEQGLLGSRAYVNKWLASRPEVTDVKEKELPSWLQKVTWPLTAKPMHSKLSAYFNLDNGGGKVRGIYAENNSSVKPIFDAWLAPFSDLGATATTLRKTGGTDHMSFDGVGVPGFQFIQDEMDYMTRTHHTNMDVYDKIVKGDMMQAAMIMASFVAHTANRDEMLPRKPMPQEPPKEDKKDDAEAAVKK
jgi:Zn-dependent M28 family amino/carboxypeptidase